MPSANDGPSELPDSGLAATSLSAGSPTSRITGRRPRVLLVQPLRARPRPSPQLGVLPLRQPLSSRSWQLRALPPWPLRARPCRRFTLRLLRRLALRAFGSLDLRFLSGFTLCLPRRLALGFSRSVALRLLGSFTLRSLDGFEPRLLCRLALRLLCGFAPGFLRGGTPCSLGCGFATRGLSPGLFSKRVELCGPVVCLLDRSRTPGDVALCLLCSGLELRHLLPCRICVRTTLFRGAF